MESQDCPRMARKTGHTNVNVTQLQAHSIALRNYMGMSIEDAQSSDSDDYGSDDDFYYSKRLDPVEDEQ